MATKPMGGGVEGLSGWNTKKGLFLAASLKHVAKTDLKLSNFAQILIIEMSWTLTLFKELSS